MLIFALRLWPLRDGVRVLESHHLLILHRLELLRLDRINQVSLVSSLRNRMAKTLLRDKSIKVVAQRARVFSEAHMSLLIQIIRDHGIITIQLQGPLHGQLIVNFCLIKEALGAL